MVVCQVPQEFNDYRQFLGINIVILNQLEVLNFIFYCSKKTLDREDFDILKYYDISVQFIYFLNKHDTFFDIIKFVFNFVQRI